MDKETGRIFEKRELIKGLFKITIEADYCDFKRPGQYAEIGVVGTKFEKAYTVSEYDSLRFTIIVDGGDPVSDKLISCEIGTEVAVKTGLGEGFDVDVIPDKAVLVADTSGIPQMVGLLRELLMRGKTCRLVLEYPSKDRIYMVDTFSNLCNNIEVVTADGSNGRQGHAYDVVRNAEYVCAAGSVSMLDKLTEKAAAGQFDLDGLSLAKW